MATIVSLLIGPTESAIATPLDNRKNTNSQNVRLSQIHEKYLAKISPHTVACAALLCRLLLLLNNHVMT